MFIKWEIWLGKASFCDPNVSSSYLPAIVICRLLLTKQMQAELFFSFFSVFKVLLLNISKTYSDSDCGKTNLRVSPFKGDQHHTMHVIQMVQEQHAIYFGYAFF